MRIALISPKGRFFGSYNEYKTVWENLSKDSLRRNFYSGLGIGLLTVAALTPKNFAIKLIDENFDSIDFGDNFDLVGITGMTQQANRAYQIADKFRKRGVKVVIGGIHATVLPEEAKEHADSVVIGEAEETWPEFLKDFSASKEKQFYKALDLADMSKSPIPRYDLLNKRDYKIVWLQATRGCPIDCEFCAASKVYGTKFRHKKIEQVIEEIKYILRLFGHGVLISFADDNMFVDRKYAIQLLEQLISLRIRWFAQTDVSVANDEHFIRLLKESGCSFLFVGFETVNKEGLNLLDRSNWKSRRFSSYTDAIQKIQSKGIGVFGAFMLGLDTDTTSIFKKLINFIRDTHLFSTQITILTPLPGTRLRDRLNKEGRLLDADWEDFTFLKATYTPKNMSATELEKGLFQVYSSVYSKESILARAKYFKNIYSALT